MHTREKTPRLRMREHAKVQKGATNPCLSTNNQSGGKNPKGERFCIDKEFTNLSMKIAGG